MKKIVLTALVAVSALCANAQVWVGGSLGFDSKSPEEGKSTTTITFEPTIGYSLSENWDIALEIREKSTSCDGASLNEFAIAPFARYTFAKSGIASFFVDGGFGFGSTEGEIEAGKLVKFEKSESSFNIGLRPGVKVELSHHVEVEAKAGYLGYRSVKDKYDFVGFNVNGEALSFGLTYKF